MMTTDKLWQTYVDEKIYEVSQRIEARLQYTARGTTMSPYMITEAVREGLQAVRDGMATEEEI